MKRKDPCLLYTSDQAPKPDFLMLVNRQHKLGKNDAPTDLVTIESVLLSLIHI